MHVSHRISALEFSVDGKTAYVALPACVMEHEVEGLRNLFGPERFEVLPNSRSWICQRRYVSARGINKHSVVIVIATGMIRKFKEFFYAWLSDLHVARSRFAAPRTA